MKKRVKGVKLSRKKAARVALAKSLTRALILSGKIKTTKAKAKFAQKYVEKLIILAKRDTLTTNRRIFGSISDKTAAKKLISEIGPKFKTKNSGFTRLINLVSRRGDVAPMALLEFAYPQIAQTEKKEEKKVKEEALPRPTPPQATRDFAGQAKAKRKEAKNETKK